MHVLDDYDINLRGCHTFKAGEERHTYLPRKVLSDGTVPRWQGEVNNFGELVPDFRQIALFL